MNLRMAIVALVALAPHAALGQQTTGPRPADPAAQVPAAAYESAFTGYRGFREEPLAPWHEVNDEVARAGGHIGILRGAAKPAASAPGGSAQNQVKQ